MKKLFIMGFLATAGLLTSSCSADDVSEETSAKANVVADDTGGGDAPILPPKPPRP